MSTTTEETIRETFQDLCTTDTIDGKVTHDQIKVFKGAKILSFHSRPRRKSFTVCAAKKFNFRVK